MRRKLLNMHIPNLPIWLREFDKLKKIKEMKKEREMVEYEFVENNIQ